MSVEKKLIPIKVQKGNRPKIEEVIAYCLDGELQKNAMDFTVWMRENKMPLKLYTSNTRSYRVMYKGWCMCFIFLHHIDDINSAFYKGKPSLIKISPTLQLLDTYKDIVISENLTDIKWDDDVFSQTCKWNNAFADTFSPCGNGCGYGSVDRTIFNKDYKYICRWRGLKVCNPDAATFEKIKRLIKLDQKARDELD